MVRCVTVGHGYDVVLHRKPCICDIFAFAQQKNSKIAMAEFSMVDYDFSEVITSYAVISLCVFCSGYNVQLSLLVYSH